MNDREKILLETAKALMPYCLEQADKSALPKTSAEAIYRYRSAARKAVGLADELIHAVGGYTNCFTPEARKRFLEGN